MKVAYYVVPKQDQWSSAPNSIVDIMDVISAVKEENVLEG